MSERLMAVLAESTHGRTYLDPTDDMEAVARSAIPEYRPDNQLPHNPRDFKTPNYGMSSFADLFTDRQLVALTTFSDLVSEAREKILTDALAAGMDAAAPRLAEGGTGAEAYADAVATYLGLGIGRASDYWNGNATWQAGGDFVAHAFARQALPMVWDFAESNPFGSASGNWDDTALGWIPRVLEVLPRSFSCVAVTQKDAAENTSSNDNTVIVTDPPYYDNIGYADGNVTIYVSAGKGY